MAVLASGSSALAHLLPELDRVFPDLQLGAARGAPVDAAIDARALVDALLVLGRLLRRADAAREHAAWRAADVDFGCRRMSAFGAAKAFDRLAVHKGQARLAVGR